MAFKVNFTELASMADAIDNGLTDLQSANSSASTAGEEAVTAAGGSGTAVGKAVEDAIKTDTEKEFDEAIKVINEMTAAMRTVSNTYSAENDELLSRIKTIAARAAEGEVSGNGSMPQ